nr:hypothetical protein OG409_31945 [Streptomyces sp. NBC_00974]
MPRLTFVRDQLRKPPIETGPLQHWADRVRKLAKVPNTVCELSGMVTEAAPDRTTADLRPYAETVLDAFGLGPDDTSGPTGR